MHLFPQRFFLIFLFKYTLKKMLISHQNFMDHKKQKLGEYKAISKVKVGDIILASDSVGNQKYSPVVFIPHKPNNIATLFTHLHTKNRDIKVTSNHIIPAGDCSGKASLPLLYAHQVRMNTRAQIRLFLFCPPSSTSKL